MIFEHDEKTTKRFRRSQRPAAGGEKKKRKKKTRETKSLNNYFAIAGVHSPRNRGVPDGIKVLLLQKCFPEGKKKPHNCKINSEHAFAKNPKC